jgi:hypothetical protein
MTYRISLVALLSLAAWAAPAYSAEPVRPNILFCFADDWGRYASAYAEAGQPVPAHWPQRARGRVSASSCSVRCK